MEEVSPFAIILGRLGIIVAHQDPWVFSGTLPLLAIGDGSKRAKLGQTGDNAQQPSRSHG